MTVRVSVVVPTYRRPELLFRCLVALLAQDFDAGQYEVIVADDGVSEETRRCVQRVVEHAASARLAYPVHSLVGVDWSAAHPAPGADARPWWPNLFSNIAPAYPAGGHQALPTVHYLQVDGGSRGPAAARNAGWKAACGQIIAFTDDDCIPAPGWLRAGVARFNGSSLVVGVSGQVVMPLPPCPTDYELNATRLEQAEFVTANCFYLREALAATGGFDERFTAAWREDSDLFFTLLKWAGADKATDCFVRAPDAIVFHPVRPAPWGVSLHQQAKNRFNALLYKKHPALYQRWLGPITPWRYYLIVSALLLAAAGFLTGRADMAGMGVGPWALLTARFCYQRLRGTSRTPAHVAEMIVTSVLIPPLSLFWRVAGAIQYRVFFL